MKRIGADASVEVVECAKTAEAVAPARAAETSLIICYTAAPQEIVQVITMLKMLGKELQAGKVRVIMTTKIQNDQLEAKVKQYGCSEIIHEPINERKLFFRLEWNLRAVQKLSKKAGGNERTGRGAAGRGGGGGAAGEADESGKWRLVDPIKLGSDFFILGDQEARRVGRRWAVQMVGPSPAAGKWVEIREEQAQAEELWKWVPTDPATDKFHKEKGSWFFRGFVPRNREYYWAFAAIKPELVFRSEDGKTETKRICMDPKGALLIAKDSETSLGFRMLIEASYENVIKEGQKKAAKEDQADLAPKEGTAPGEGDGKDQPGADERKVTDGRNEQGQDPKAEGDLVLKDQKEKRAKWGEMKEGEEEGEERLIRSKLDEKSGEATGAEPKLKKLGENGEETDEEATERKKHAPDERLPGASRKRKAAEEVASEEEEAKSPDEKARKKPKTEFEKKAYLEERKEEEEKKREAILAQKTAIADAARAEREARLEKELADDPNWNRREGGEEKEKLDLRKKRPDGSEEEIEEELDLEAMMAKAKGEVEAEDRASALERTLKETSEKSKRRRDGGEDDEDGAPEGEGETLDETAQPTPKARKNKASTEEDDLEGAEKKKRDDGDDATEAARKRRERKAKGESGDEEDTDEDGAEGDEDSVGGKRKSKRGSDDDAMEAARKRRERKAKGEEGDGEEDEPEISEQDLETRARAKSVKNEGDEESDAPKKKKRIDEELEETERAPRKYAGPDEILATKSDLPTITPVAVIFLLAELLSLPKTPDLSRMVYRFGKYISASCGGMHLEVWALVDDEWRCASTSDNSPGRLGEQVKRAAAGTPLVEGETPEQTVHVQLLRANPAQAAAQCAIAVESIRVSAGFSHRSEYVKYFEIIGSNALGLIYSLLEAKPEQLRQPLPEEEVAPPEQVAA